MNKQELEKCCDRLSKQINNFRIRINRLKKHLENDSSLFKKGLADDSEYNQGCMNFLNHYIEVCNKLFGFNLEPIINTKVYTLNFTYEGDNDEN